MGANLNMWETDMPLVQFTYAHAFNVTDGFPQVKQVCGLIRDVLLACLENGRNIVII
jgi:hypothetical protein